jgi:hypothetical protein
MFPRLSAGVVLAAALLAPVPAVFAGSDPAAAGGKVDPAVSCRCCTECLSAQKKLGTAGDAGPTAGKNGCRQCCERCGLKPPTPAPPEKIEEGVRKKLQKE